MNVSLTPLVLIFLLSSLELAGQSIESVPNQKRIDGSYVSNPDGILKKETIVQIDSILTSLENKQSVQIAVVALKSIGDADVFEFAQTLFNRWGIGKNDNGLLILLVKDVPAIRFHTGYGVEGSLPDVVCKRIQRDHMVPLFKRGDYDQGMLAGIIQIEKVLASQAAGEQSAEATEEVGNWVGFVFLLSITLAPSMLVAFIVKAGNGRFKGSKKSKGYPYPEMLPAKWVWLVEFVAIPILIITLFGVSANENPIGMSILALYGYFLLTAFHRLIRGQKVINRFLKAQDYYEIVEFLRKQQWYWFIMALVFPLPFAFYFPYHLLRKRIYRNHPRKCKDCAGRMTKLTEQQEDAYLSDGQKIEETLRSVDYDVWQCESCRAVEMWFYLNSSSKYEPCPKCKTIAYHFISRRTVVGATYSSSGSGEQIHGCKFCGYQQKSTYTIPRLEHSASTSDNSFGSSGSSSSGGSWGGGRSGGGGASSTW